MKPECPFDPPKLSGLARAELRAAKRQCPQTACFFQSGVGGWRGSWSPYDGEKGSGFHNFRSLSREYFTESSRERAKETTVFALVALTSAWPVIYMVITVVKLLSKGQP
ncbi:MAG TPA: hypothetical protein VGZ24_06665 [Chthoniobacterales bacterium]|jgi:hypothetical protein|nr:hypothetical protein [Chthoniobacterales bacterium]